MVESVSNSDDNGLLKLAEQALASSPETAIEIYRRVLQLDPANVYAHNALEKLRAPGCFSEWMLINSMIDPRDDIFAFFVRHELAQNPIREYLCDGWRTLSELMVLLETVDRPLLKAKSVLEFAAGYGRFTRHLVKVLPGRVTCSDVLPGTIDFLREQFGVDGFYSDHNPALVTFEHQYDLVFALSMFTHLPPPMWTAWLQVLYQAVKPGGLLIFSVHNEEVARRHGISYAADGTYFITSSESSSIAGETYGTTFTTRSFVEDTIHNALEVEVDTYRAITFWAGQDAIVVAKK